MAGYKSALKKLARCFAIDQRFAAEKELAFLNTLDHELMNTGRASTIVFLVVQIIVFLLSEIAISRVWAIINMIGTLLFIILLCWRGRYSRLTYDKLELLFVVWHSLSLICICLDRALASASETWLWRDYAAINARIVISVTIFVSCLVTPIRTHVSWIVPCWSICCGLVILATTESEKDAEVVLLGQTVAAILCFSVGFRKELLLRERWLAQCNAEKHRDLSEKYKECLLHVLHCRCDCLVHLGPGFEITEPCPGLQSMLCLTSGRSLQGTSFLDYISCTEDQQRFVEALRKDQHGRIAGTLPMHLQHANGREFQVHVYHTSFRDGDHSLYHILGVVNSGPLEVLTTPAVHLATPSIGVGAVMDSDRRKIENADDDMTFATGTTIILDDVASGDIGEVALTFDDSCGFKVVSCTAAFTQMCGPLEGRPRLLDWIRDGERFAKTAEDLVNEYRNCSFGTVVLRTPSSTRAGIEYIVHDCYVDRITTIHPDHDDDGDDDDDENNNNEPRYAVRLRLDCIQRRRLHKRERRREQRQQHLPVTTLGRSNNRPPTMQL